MISKAALIAAALLACLLPAQGQQTAAHTRESGATSEAFRARRVLSLLQARNQLIASRDNEQWTDAMDARLEAIDRQLRACPAPAYRDSAVYSKILPGRWKSGGREYHYRTGGRWSSPPVGYEGTSHGVWEIDGNHFKIDHYLTYIIILLSPFDFVYMDGEGNIHSQKRF